MSIDTLITVPSLSVKLRQGGLDSVGGVMAKMPKPMSVLKRGDFPSLQAQMRRETAI
jgi:hypothetical protein